MFSHFTVGADDLATAKAFYDAALTALGHEVGVSAGDRIVYTTGVQTLLVTRPIDRQRATFGNGSTIGLLAPSKETVDLFYRNGLAAGGSDAGEPGPRPAIPNSYAAYLRDPTGNKIVAWCVRSDGD